ncbi:MAG: hypothetical protein LUF02_09090 [Erysipelotrichaceae bacterium]|nr:hypothetical protein [Erysipelotrichaceae bacterium]
MNILSMILTPLFTFVVGSLCTYIVGLRQNKKKTEERLQKIENAEKAILHQTILKKCNLILMIGNVTPEEIDELEYLYQPYQAIGGNHRAGVAYEKVLELPRIKNRNEEE